MDGGAAESLILLTSGADLPRPSSQSTKQPAKLADTIPGPASMHSNSCEVLGHHFTYWWSLGIYPARPSSEICRVVYLDLSRSVFSYLSI